MEYNTEYLSSSYSPRDYRHGSSQQSSANNSPRSLIDDRFYTPRSMTNSNNIYAGSSDNDEQWVTPRGLSARASFTYYSPRQTSRSEDTGSDYGTPRNDNNTLRHSHEYYNTNSEAKVNTDYVRHASVKATTAASSNTYNNYGNNSISSSSSNNNRSSSNSYPSLYEYKHSDYNSSNYVEDDTDYSNSNNRSSSSNGMGVREEDVDAIFRFARHGRLNEIETLIHEGVPVDVRDENGNTLLIIACQNGNKRVAKLVLRYGANINSRNHRGNTPLHYAFHFGYGDTLGQYLISKGADDTSKNNAGKVVYEGI